MKVTTITPADVQNRVETGKIAKIIPFRPSASPKPQQTEQEEIDELVDMMVETELAQFAEQLIAARLVWRKYPELVTAPTIPEHLREAHMAEFDEGEPENIPLYYEPYVSRATMRELRRRAKKTVEGAKEYRGA